MSLQLGQLIYTSFNDVGFSLLKSQQVSDEKKKFFVEHVVHKYWNSYAPLDSGQRAAYLNQPNSQCALFGWLFNDGLDDVGRDNVPYFIAYCIESEISVVQLKLIFEILAKGPLSLIERQQVPDSLPDVLIPDPYPDQSSRLGVNVSPGKRECCSTFLERGALLNLLVQVNVEAQHVRQLTPKLCNLSQEVGFIEKQQLDRHHGHGDEHLNEKCADRVVSLPLKSLLSAETGAKRRMGVSRKCAQLQNPQTYQERLTRSRGTNGPSELPQLQYNSFSGVLAKVNELDSSASSIDHLVNAIHYFSDQINKQVINACVEEGGSKVVSQYSALLIAEIVHSFSHQIRHAVADIESLIKAIQAETDEIASEIETEQQRVITEIRLVQLSNARLTGR